MNSGAEAVETAMKLSRKWAYEKKGVPMNEAVIISAAGCFHGRTIGIVSMSDDPSARDGFGPFLPGKSLNQKMSHIKYCESIFSFFFIKTQN